MEQISITLPQSHAHCCLWEIQQKLGRGGLGKQERNDEIYLGLGDKMSLGLIKFLQSSNIKSININLQS